MKKYFLFSDTHGQYEPLIAALDEAGFDKNNKDHWLISVGDLFDRGRENVKIYNFLDSIERKHLIFGNHDEFFLEFLKGNFLNFDWNCDNNGLWETLRDFAALPEDETWHYWHERTEELRRRILTRHPKIIEFMKSMKEGILIDKNVITHAGFKENILNEKWYVDNFANTIRFINLNVDKYPNLTFIFGHWHAFLLYKGFSKTLYYDRKFEFKNFIGLDACSNFTFKVFVHTIESNSQVEFFGGSITLDMLDEYGNLESF